MEVCFFFFKKIISGWEDEYDDEDEDDVRNSDSDFTKNGFRDERQFIWDKIMRSVQRSYEMLHIDPNLLHLI